MKVAVIQRQVPDVVEELVVAEDGRSLSENDVMYVTNEADEHALEQALLLKARHAAKVVVFGLGGDEARDALATAVAKGADEATFVPIPFESRGDNHRVAAHLAPALASGGFDLVLTGVWASDQLDAGLAGLLAVRLSLPYLGGLTSASVQPDGRKAIVRKEFAGGRLGVFEVALPAVLGIQSAEQPPRYAAMTKVMQAKRTLQAKELGGSLPDAKGLAVAKLMKPESGAKAEMLTGDAAHVADSIVRIVRERGLA